ncbi:MAG: RNA polymerase factor sigma-54 [Pseudomonadota bacterium]|nr:RNA polymerase factor sigma-54 [Pseudomonadota bacterium]
MSVALSLSTKQSMSISPRLQQAIRMLQLSAVEFDQELRDSLSDNPFLEEVEEPEEPANASADASPELQADSPDPGVDDWDGSSLGSAFERTRSSTGGGGDGTDLSWVPEKLGLREHLRNQLYASRASERIVIAAEIVIDTLDEDGYLRDDLNASFDAVEVDPPLLSSEIDEALALVRRFDPAGVGAIDLVDCLSLQLNALDPSEGDRELAMGILTHHLQLLARHDYVALYKKLNHHEERVREACALIRRLDPHPGSRYSPKAPDYVIPDVLVVRHRGAYKVKLNPAVRPRARLNQQYADLLRRNRNEHSPAMSQQLQQARWFLRNADQRFDTIQRVAECIVEHQSDFFAHGDIALKPMVLREVADELGLHESTVSRATNNKHMQTPRGCFEFKHFFSRELQMRHGPACSATAVRALIREIIAEEGSDAPLSDVDIAIQLRAQGIRIARRTVSKYRHMLRLPPAELRRRA